MQTQDIPSSTHERLVRVEDGPSGLVGYIAIHSTQRGPAAGGLRFHPYESEAEAIADVKRLSRGMTYKNAAAGLPLGGGKAVIMGHPATDKTPERLLAFGKAIQSLGGLYWTAEDMGMCPADMDLIARETDFVAGLSNGSGDPSPVTAEGVFRAIRVTCRHTFGSPDPAGRTVSLQGLGHVGLSLARKLHAAGARLILTDIDEARLRNVAGELQSEMVPPDAIFDAKADLFAPSAIGAILNEDTIARLKVRAICGAANNQLAKPEDGLRLHERGILYAPDYIVNAGGVINVAAEILKIEDRAIWAGQKLADMEAFLEATLKRAREENLPPEAIADKLVEQMITSAAA